MSVWKNTYFDSSRIASWDKRRRVCAPRRFPTYFTYGIGPDVFSQSELDSILALIPTPSEFKARIEQLVSEIRSSGESRAAIIVDELQHDPESAGNAELAAATLLEVADIFIPPNDNEGSLTRIPMGWRLNWVIEGQLKRLSPQQRFEVVKVAVEKSPSLLVVTSTVNDLEREHDPDATNPVAEEDRLIDSAAVKKLSKALAKRLADEANNGRLIDSLQLSTLLFRWGRADGFEKVKTWTKAQMADGHSALMLARAVTGYSHVHSLGDVAARRIPRVDARTSDKILDFEALTSQLDKIKAQTDLSGEEQQILADFFQGLQSRSLD